jgi:hypothetical protein
MSEAEKEYYKALKEWKKQFNKSVKRIQRMFEVASDNQK